MLVVGVDGWKLGWVAVALRDGHFEAALATAAFGDVLAAFPDAASVGVDIPIGLPPPFPRRADLAARTRLGSAGARVFLTFPRPVYEATTQREATVLALELCKQGVSQQSFALAKKILEVDRLATANPQVAEVHPEISYYALAGETLPSKRTWAGQAARREALAQAGVLPPEDLGDAGRVPPDDVLDAAAAAWTALRIACRRAETLPSDPAAGEPTIRY